MAKNKVNLAALKYQIALYARDVETDAGGYTIGNGEPRYLYTVNASVRGVKGLEAVEMGAAQVSETLEFTIRWREIDTSMVIVYKGKQYEIERADPAPYEGQYRRIWAHSVRGEGT